MNTGPLARLVGVEAGDVPGTLLPQLYVLVPVKSDSPSRSCDCLAHVYGTRATGPGGCGPTLRPDGRRVGGWRDQLPVPARMNGKGGQPQGYCHRQMIDAIRYLVAGGITWRAMPADLPAWDRVYAFFRRWRANELIAEFHDRLRGQVRQREGQRGADRSDHRLAVGERRRVGAGRLTGLRRRQEDIRCETVLTTPMSRHHRPGPLTALRAGLRGTRKAPHGSVDTVDHD